MADVIKIRLDVDGEPVASQHMDKFGKAAEKAGDKVTGLGKESGDLPGKTKKASDGLEKFGYEAKILDQQVVVLRKELGKLAAEFERTGDVDVLRKIKVRKQDLDDVTKLRKEITGLLSGAVDGGVDVGSKIGESLTKSLMALRGPAIAAAVGIGVAMLPAIGVAISTAVIGGVGAGGIVGGIAAASQDQRVQDAAAQVGNRVKDGLVDASAAFVGPLIESLNILDNAGARLADNFEAASSKIAPVLPALAGGLGGFADAVGPGFVRAMDAAKPVIRAISHELPKIGDAVGDFFDKLSDDPDQAVMGVVAISQAIQGTIDSAGSLLDTLGDIFEWSSRSGAALAGTWETLFGWMPVVGGAVSSQADSFRQQVAAIDGANDASKDYAGEGIQEIIRGEEDAKDAHEGVTNAIEDEIRAMDKLFGRTMDASELADRYEESIDNLSDSVKKNGATLDVHTEQGRANRDALRERLEIIKDERDAIIETTGDVEQANAVYQQRIDALYREGEALGLSKKGIDDVAAAIRDLPRLVELEVRAPGLIDALARAQLLNRLMGNISAGARARAGDDSGYGGGRAGGGPMEAGKWYTVGENGVEMVQMHAGGGATVHSADQTQAMMSGASGGSAASYGGGSGGRPQVSITYAASGNTAMDAFIQAIWPFFLKQVRVDGGDLTAFGAA